MLKSLSLINQKSFLYRVCLLNRSIRLASSTSPTVTKTQRNIPKRIAPNASWSSPNDGIVRNVFGSNAVRAWTLLEACLAEGNMTRAESVLHGLCEFSDNTDTALAVNTFLQRLIDLNKGKPHVVTDWLQNIEFQIPKFRRDHVTQALLLRNACSPDLESPPSLIAFLNRYSSDVVLQLVRQVETVGIENIVKVLASGKITRDMLSPSIKKLLDAYESSLVKKNNNHEENENGIKDDIEVETLSSTSSIDFKLADPIKKDGVDSLEPTESSGLVAVRHILSALQVRTKSQKRGINELMKLAEMPHVQDKGVEDVNFFEMWKQLKTDEEKAVFSSLLEKINEQRQRNIETKGFEASRMRWRQIFDQMIEIDKSHSAKVQLRALETLLWEWNQAMTPLLKMEFNRIMLLTPYSHISEVPKEILNEHFAGMKPSHIVDRLEIAPYLALSKLENLPAMTMMELLRVNKPNEHIKVARVMLDVGKNLEREHKLEMRKKEEEQKSLTPGLKTNARTWKHAVSSLTLTWPNAIKLKIGTILVNILLQTARVRVYGTDPVTGEKVHGTSPAFYHTYQYHNGSSIGVIKPHKVVASYLSYERVSIQPQQLPMLCKPRKWTSWDSGGYWFTPSQIVRTKDSPEQLAYIATASNKGHLTKIFEGLNVLGEVPWTINRDIFKVVSEIWNTKKEFLDIPPHVSPIPDLSSIPKPARNVDPSEFRDYKRKCRAESLAHGSLYSQRCDLNYKLDIARALLGERFYMPHNLDFRGRAYPLSPHFNHLGNDVSRSLLLFWEGKKLGPSGLWWLKIHLANLFGLNKSTHAQRVQHIDDNIQKVLDCASDPLNPKNNWWKSADGPFQALATCIEIKKALEHPDGPENYESHLTIHQDGSCNGLQHYAALGGDSEGAREVNLDVADRPQDVYSRVLDIVKAKVENEPNKQYQDLAQKLLPVLSRKVVKQTVMTHVYGVTYVGARTQISNRLREIEDYPRELVFKGSSYLARLILSAVRELFESAHQIQDWLGNNASRIAKAVVIDKDLNDSAQKQVSSVIWTSPLGLPIVQPYRMSKKELVKTELQTVSITDPYSFQSVNARKQRTAFPPNFIHSLDATHMLMSALKCAQDKITFAAVHDSYWTHAADVPELNKNLRQCFVELYQKSLIQRLKDEFLVRYANHVEMISIPADSETGKAIKAIHDKFSREKYGKRKKLVLADQIELEYKLQEEDPDAMTPLKIMSSLSISEVDKLEQCALAFKEPRSNRREVSSEHKGAGLENTKLDTEEEENFDEDDKDDVMASLSTSKSVINVITPIRIPDIPARGEFDVNKVLDSLYFFN